MGAWPYRALYLVVLGVRPWTDVAAGDGRAAGSAGVGGMLTECGGAEGARGGKVASALMKWCLTCLTRNFIWLS